MDLTLLNTTLGSSYASCDHFGGHFHLGDDIILGDTWTDTQTGDTQRIISLTTNLYVTLQRKCLPDQGHPFLEAGNDSM